MDCRKQLNAWRQKMIAGRGNILLRTVTSIQGNESSSQPFNVIRLTRMDNIEIKSREGRALENGGNPPNDDKLNIMLDELPQQFQEIRFLHSWSGCHKRC